MRIGIVGCRDLPEAQAHEIRDYIKQLPSDTILVTGDCPTGADYWARYYAQVRNLCYVTFAADWTTHGRAAGPIRNREIVAASDKIVAWWDGVSPGTRDTIKQAGEHQVPVEKRMFVRPIADRPKVNTSGPLQRACSDGVAGCPVEHQGPGNTHAYHEGELR